MEPISEQYKTQALLAYEKIHKKIIIWRWLLAGAIAIFALLVVLAIVYSGVESNHFTIAFLIVAFTFSIFGLVCVIILFKLSGQASALDIPLAVAEYQSQRRRNRKK